MSDDSLVIATIRDKVSIAGDRASLIWRIVDKLDGRISLRAVSESLKLDLDQVISIANALYDCGAICDSHKIYEFYCAAAGNPSPFASNLTDEQIVEWQETPRLPVAKGDVYTFEPAKNSWLQSIQSSRKSVRSYTNEPLTIDEVGRLCAAGYGFANHAVPSGGALYPLKVYAIVANGSSNMPTGYYEYDPQQNNFVRFGALDQSAINFVFGSSHRLFNAPVQLVITADLNRQSYKYSNMGYRLTTIEAGQVAQNVTLAALEMSLGTCELGGPLESVLRRELDMPEAVIPLLAIAVGHPSDESWYDDATLRREVFENVERITPNKIQSVSVEAKPASSFYSATVAFDDGYSSDVAGGRSTSADLAITKALVESCERIVSCTARSDMFAPASGLDIAWINPGAIMPLSAEQKHRLSMEPFSADKPIGWTLGCMFESGIKVAVPTGCVYYDPNYKQDNVAFCTSSGVAAHMSFGEAVENAALELIERDALMRMWITHTKPRLISRRCLPLHLQKQMDRWLSNGYQMCVFQLDSMYANVALVVLHSEHRYPAFVSGADAEIDFVVAAQKAYEEAENQLVYLLQSSQRTSVDANQIATPEDHGLYYAQNENLPKVSWMWHDARPNSPADSGVSIDSAMREMRAIVVDMSPDSSRIKVARVLSRYMVPITFGYGNECYMHPALAKVKAINHMPHFFA